VATVVSAATAPRTVAEEAEEGEVWLTDSVAMEGMDKVEVQTAQTVTMGVPLP
jgi:hypothetical protein